jgi:protocatechuate 3,4-dioxygenase alpha subunit
MSLQTTSSQTVGPYLHIGLTWLVTDNLVGPGVSGETVTIEGRITDGDGKPVNDALVEIWQANAHGKYAHPDDPQDKPLEPGFKGFGRVPTDDSGAFRFTTIKPGRVAAPGGGLQAPHINVTLFMRGMLKQLNTRIYFPADPANAEDAVLQSVPPARRETLIASPSSGRPGALEWNVVLQGAGETVFFEC